MPALFQCIDGEDFLTLRTPFVYPDGDIVDLYVTWGLEGIVVTDLGETARWLEDRRFDISRRSQAINESLAAVGASMNSGEITVTVKEPDEIAGAVLALAQAVTRLFDFLYLQRSRSISVFTDEVGAFFDQHKIRYVRDYSVTGMSGHTYDFDFGVYRDKDICLVRLLTASSPSNMNQTIDRVLRQWYDVSPIVEAKTSRLSLFDDSVAWTTNLITLIERISVVRWWDEPEDLLAFLRDS